MLKEEILSLDYNPEQIKRGKFRSNSQDTPKHNFSSIGSTFPWFYYWDKDLNTPSSAALGIFVYEKVI